ERLPRSILAANSDEAGLFHARPLKQYTAHGGDSRGRGNNRSQRLGELRLEVGGKSRYTHLRFAIHRGLRQTPAKSRRSAASARLIWLFTVPSGSEVWSAISS